MIRQKDLRKQVIVVNVIKKPSTTKKEYDSGMLDD